MTLALRWRLTPPPLALRFRLLPPVLTLRWRGPDGSLAAMLAAASASPLPTPAAISSIAAIVGPPGVSAPPFSAVCDATLPAGTPLAVSRATGHLVKADAATKSVASVAGLAGVGTSAGFVADSVRGMLTLADWSGVVGSQHLAQGQTYFLAAGGGLTTTPPSSPNCLVVVGTAASSTTMLIEPQSPVQL